MLIPSKTPQKVRGEVLLARQWNLSSNTENVPQKPRQSPPD
ncbi:hypothetical protein PROVRUST_08458 [Providencia rustigianii DSM 4541]|uniref:Uncharacterized protein n=1 Tax=Providencia rustigianii DSM 4541 TaxID=500637 RepID=D1P877_9GAMM|nr:hypothetical protein PROVRUST_08458 [Providencia rustigianii DSM 4541]